MSHLARASALIGRPIVTLDTATDVAEVKDVVYAPERSEVIGFTLRGRGFLSTPDAGALRLTDVRSVGHAAIMVASADRIRGDDPDLARAQSERRDVVGGEVLTDAGNVIGRVLDLVVEIDGSHVTVVGYEVRRHDGSHALIPVPETFSVSGERLLVPAAVEGIAGHDLADFGTALARERERAGRTASGVASARVAARPGRGRHRGAPAATDDEAASRDSNTGPAGGEPDETGER